MIRILLFLLLFAGSVSAQKTVQIIDASNDEPVPFARIDPQPGNPLLADIDGFFVIPEGTLTVKISAATFTDTNYTVSEIGATVKLAPLGDELEEFVVLPGINPAERIMEQAIANRKKNHPMGDESFTYDTYSKFVFTMDQDALATISDTTTDTMLMSIKQLFDKQHIFMMESTTKKYFEPPFREKEVISAYKVSGFSDPAFSTFANEMQSFNFYDNQFELLGKTYINPLAFGSIRRYHFILEDTTIVGTDSTFTIRFQPRKGKNFDGMKGWLYINTNGFALEKVIAEPAEESAMIRPKIIQEYALVDGKKWFPVKLSTEAVFPALRLNSKLENSYLVGKGSTYIENVKIGADVSKERFNAITVQTADDASEKDTSHWAGNRKYQLSDKEKNTYVVLDSVSKAEHFDQKLILLRALADGKIPLGNFQIDLKRLIDYRDYEGYRLGLGLETSKKLWKRGTAGGYFGYGTRDKDWKYGGYAKYTIIKDYFFEIQGSFQEDLVERGGYSLLSQEQSFNFDDLYRHLYVANMERQRKAELALSAYITPNLRVLAGVNYQRVRLTDGYAYQSPDGGTFDGGRSFDQAESNVEVIWTFRDKLMYLGDKRVSLGSKWPVLSAKWSQGISGIENSQFDYSRFNIDIKQDIPIRAAGTFSYMLTAGKSIGDVPLYLTQVAVGTGRDWNVSVKNTFESMAASSFYNKEQVALFTRFELKKFKMKVSWSSPQLIFHHAMGTGSFDRKGDHTVPGRPVQSMDKGYYEAGVLLNSIVNVGFVGIGIGGFYNYGPYAVADETENITVKLGITVNLFK